jgi:acid phosphatase
MLTFACGGGCGSSRSTDLSHEDLDATLWMQTSAEYVAATEQAFWLGRQMLKQALGDPTWSALPDQQAELAASSKAAPLLPAVIVDIDETVLDNSPYQAAVIKNEGEYDLDAWQVWVERAEAEAVPGARAFLDACRESGVTVFFVTNRVEGQEQLTRRNLEQQLLLPVGAADTILSKFELDDWTTDKTSRRQHVAQHYRILLIVGDDLNDFVWAGEKPSAKTRRETSQRYAHLWGEKWIILPNANYGSWERALYGFDDALPRQEKLLRKQRQLR